MRDDLCKFIENFDIVENALNQRTLVRWNGRDLKYRENLSEHTHLVVACAMRLIKELSSVIKFTPEHKVHIYELCMIHDSLELLRGDILSITKDAIEGLREAVDYEEDCFMKSVIDFNPSLLEKSIVKLADLEACYIFLEKEMQYPTNDFAKNNYQICKDKFDKEFAHFCKMCNIKLKPEKTVPTIRFSKGYDADAGIDILLDKKVTFMPQSTTRVDLNVYITPDIGKMAFLCARTSAAAKGLCVAMCPIDPNYTGIVTAIVHNISNDIIEYNVGEAFCQVIGTDAHDAANAYVVRKQGKRTDSKLGGTGNVSNS